MTKWIEYKPCGDPLKPDLDRIPCSDIMLARGSGFIDFIKALS
jgi:hypothetical protein